MKPAVTCLLVLLLSSLLPAQTGSDAAAQPSAPVTPELVRALQQSLAAQQKQMGEQQRELDALRQRLAAKRAPHVAEAALATGSTAPAPPPAAQEPPPQESPLSFRIGKMDFTPGGFLDFSAVFRSTNLGSGVASNFAAFPFNNTVAGHLTETRLTAQYSRLTLKAEGTFGRNQITGYVETDFNGNDAANVFVTSNSHTDRLRVYWVEVRRGKWEILAGQAYTWLTPSRRELSPLPADLFVTLDVDPTHHVGLTFTRAAQFRVTYHPTEHWSLGLALENPQQFLGPGTPAEVAFPAAFNAALGPQFDAANNPGTPNLHPDIIPKIAYDTDFNGKHIHAEVAGLITSMKATVVPTVAGATFDPHSHTGAGLEAALNLEVVKNFHLVASGFWSDAGGRYIDGLGPDVVARPVPAAGAAACLPGAAGTCTIALSPVHSGSGIVGFEAQVTKNHLLAVYYGGAYFQRNAFPDLTSPTVLLTPIACSTGAPLQTQPCIGFGGTGSPNTANRAIQEASLDWFYTLWQDPNYGKLQLLTQWSYAVRSPWFVTADAPKNAHLLMTWVNLRYTLP